MDDKFSKANEKNEGGDGLFKSVISPENFKKICETKIISYLDIHDLITCALVNKNPWFLRFRHEIRRRKNCVTIYTWGTNRNSTSAINLQGNALLSQFQLGHSALKTYTGSKDDKGVYVSFYPGNCNTRNNHSSCIKSVAHFHTFYQDDMNEVTTIDLFGLDVEKLNKAFGLLHDPQMDSVKPWSTRYNCSDVVLYLLKEAGLFEKVNYNPFNWMSGFLVSYMTSRFFRALLDGAYFFFKLRKFLRSPETHHHLIMLSDEQTKMQFLGGAISTFFIKPAILNSVFLWTFSFLSLSTMIEYRNIYTTSVRGLVLFVDGLIDAPAAFILTYYITNFILKNKYHSNEMRKAAWQNAKRAGLLATLTPFIKFFALNLLNYMGLPKLSEIIKNMESVFVFGNSGYIYHTNYVIKHLLDLPLVESLIKGSIVIGYPVYLLFGSLFSARFFYDTTTTPKHVQNVSKKAYSELIVSSFENKVNKNYSQNNSMVFFKDIGKKVYTHRYKAVGVLFATVGVFSVGKILNNSKSISNVSFEPSISTFKPTLGGKYAI